MKQTNYYWWVYDNKENLACNCYQKFTNAVQAVDQAETDWLYLTKSERKNRNIIVFKAPVDLEDQESPDLEQAFAEIWSGK